MVVEVHLLLRSFDYKSSLGSWTWWPDCDVLGLSRVACHPSMLSSVPLHQHIHTNPPSVCESHRTTKLGWGEAGQQAQMGSRAEERGIKQPVDQIPHHPNLTEQAALYVAAPAQTLLARSHPRLRTPALQRLHTRTHPWSALGSALHTRIYVIGLQLVKSTYNVACNKGSRPRGGIMRGTRTRRACAPPLCVTAARHTRVRMQLCSSVLGGVRGRHQEEGHEHPRP